MPNLNILDELIKKLPVSIDVSHKIATFTYYGSLNIEMQLKFFFCSQIGRNQEAKAGESVWYWLVLSRSFAREIFGVNVTSSWRHYVRAIWLGEHKSCVRDVTCLSLQSMAEGMREFRHAEWQCVEGRRAAGNYSWTAKGRNRQGFLRQVIRPFQREKWTKPSSDILYFHAPNFVTLPIFSKQTLFQKVDVLHINCTKRFLRKISSWRKHSYDWAANAREKMASTKKREAIESLPLERVSLCQFLDDERRQTDDK